MPGGIDRQRILVVDDEVMLRTSIARNLTGHGFSVTAVGSGEEGLDAAARFHPHLVILDLGLPGIDGFTVIERLRSSGGETPIIVLSVRGAERDKVRALDLGADDYLTKPFGVDELLARLRVALRHAARAGLPDDRIVRTADMTIDLERRLVAVGGEPVHLSPTEYELLAALSAQPGRVVTVRTLLQRVWGPEYGSENHYLHVYMARLRKKLESASASAPYLQTEPGVGYRLLEIEPTSPSRPR